MMNAELTFKRRIGQTPQANGVACAGCWQCPDIWELENGDFAVIGADITDAAQLPPDVGCAPHERIVRLPRRVFLNAKRDLPDAL